MSFASSLSKMRGHISAKIQSGRNDYTEAHFILIKFLNYSLKNR